MFVQPVGVRTLAKPNVTKSKAQTFKAIDLSPYQNYEGGPIPDIEMEKYCKTIRAKILEDMGKFQDAASEWFSIAEICRSQGKERDAFLCETSAHKLLKGLHI